MDTGDDVSKLLTTLPGGARVLSALVTEQWPFAHVYRVVSRTGAALHECGSLVELNAFLNRYVAEQEDAGDD